MSAGRTERLPISPPSEAGCDEAKRAAARAFAAAMDACTYVDETGRVRVYTLEYVATLCGVSATRVRKWRSTTDDDLDISPPVYVIILADHQLGERFLRELVAARLALHGPAPVVTLEQQVSVSMQAATAFVGCGLAKLSDRTIDPTEIPELDERAAAAVAEIETTRAQLRAVRR